MVFQESVVEALGNKLDNDTLETFELAEQLSTNLTDLNLEIEGKAALTTDAVLSSRSHVFPVTIYFY